MIKNFLLLVLIYPSLLIAEVIIDVRTLEEFQSAHLNKAINIEWQNILSIQKNFIFLLYFLQNKNYAYFYLAILESCDSESLAN